MLCEIRRRFAQYVDGELGVCQGAAVVDAAYAGLGDEFAVDAFGCYESLEGVVVGKFETTDRGVLRVFEEAGGAVAAVLLGERISDVGQDRRWECCTRPVAPQQASRASSITTLGPLLLCPFGFVLPLVSR